MLGTWYKMWCQLCSSCSCPLSGCKNRSSPCATRDSVVTRTAITSATGHLCASSPQPLWAPTLSNPPTGSPGTFLHSASPLSGPDPGPPPHTPSRALSHRPPAQTPPANPGSAALPGVGPSWALVEGLQQPPPGHYGYTHACGHTLQQTLGAVSSTALLPIHLRGREAGDAVAGVVYISLVV